MIADKLKEIIETKNGKLEQMAVNRAGEIIDKIGQLQQTKKDADKHIAELREELKALEIQQIDATSILG